MATTRKQPIDDLEADVLASFREIRQQARKMSRRKGTKYLIVKLVVDGNMEDVWVQHEDVWVQHLNPTVGRGVGIVRERRSK
jgi:hypothetical protein